MIILGIDPGTTRLGYGVIKKDLGLGFIDCGVLGDKTLDEHERLVFLEKELKKLIVRYKPNLVGLEKVFFSKNKKTALLVAEVRGVILALLKRRGIIVLEFSPSDIKKAVAGDGFCDKNALARIVASSLGVKNPSWQDDASDALAIAIRASFEVPRMG
jgi:crossover junction endodeoxyribonuclease RuvC